MKETSSQKLRLGIFMVLGSVVFLLAIYFVGNKQSLFGRTVPLYAIFNNVNGLQPGNNVRYSGIDAGTVRHITMVNDTTIRVEMAIERNILLHIKKDAVAAISSDGLVGSMVINIIPGVSTVPVSAEGEIRSYSRVQTEDMLKTLNVTNENAAQLTADLLQITNNINMGKGSIGVLLNDTLMASDMKETLHYLHLSSRETARSIQKLNQLLESLDNDQNVIGVIKDTSVANKIRNLIENLDHSGKEMNHTIGNLNQAVTDIRNGKGAVNYLTQNPESAQKIDSVITHFNEAGILLKQDLEALKHNFLLRGYFRKQEKDKNKNKVK